MENGLIIVYTKLLFNLAIAPFFYFSESITNMARGKNSKTGKRDIQFFRALDLLHRVDCVVQLMFNFVDSS